MKRKWAVLAVTGATVIVIAASAGSASAATSAIICVGNVTCVGSPVSGVDTPLIGLIGNVRQTGDGLCDGIGPRQIPEGSDDGVVLCRREVVIPGATRYHWIKVGALSIGSNFGGPSPCATVSGVSVEAGGNNVVGVGVLSTCF
jgi:hypothetical protein